MFNRDEFWNTYKKLDKGDQYALLSYYNRCHARKIPGIMSSILNKRCPQEIEEFLFEKARILHPPWARHVSFDFRTNSIVDAGTGRKSPIMHDVGDAHYAIVLLGDALLSQVTSFEAYTMQKSSAVAE